MHINNIPAELFAQILDYIPLKNALDIMLVNKTWHTHYHALLRRQSKKRFEEILFSEPDSNQQFLFLYQTETYWNRIIADKLFSFCHVFDNIYIYMRFKDIRATLEKEIKDSGRQEVDRLMAEYEASPDFDPWYPDWLWKLHKNTPYRNDIKSKLDILERRLKACKQKELEQVMALIHFDQEFRHIP
jgi:hypothetical protein